MTSVMIVFVTAVLVNNVVLSQFLGLPGFFGGSARVEEMRRLYLPMLVVMAAASGAVQVVNTFVLVPFGLDCLRTPALVVVIAAVVWLVGCIGKDFGCDAAEAMPLLSANCVVLGAALVNVVNGYGFLLSVFAGAGAAVGYMVVIELMDALRERMAENDVPAPFRGAPILLLAAALMAMAFCGFGNLSF